ncbi:efflux RND transporter periplasmic adaptor subunit [soil metagenome]
MMYFRLSFPRRAVGLAVAACVISVVAACGAKKEEAKASAKPALTVVVVSPHTVTWPLQIQASGNVAAWQEASVGAEIGGLKLSEVLVNIGDTVRKGQVLARFSDVSVRHDLAMQKAAVQEAEANLQQAKHNIDRARELEPSGSISRQDLVNYQTQAATTAARLESARAMLASQALKLGYAQVTATDDGVISARSATVGSVVAPGAELFKLIRKSRLEWRGELRAEDLLRVQHGQSVGFIRPDGVALTGTVRQVAPTVDTNARTGLVYVDLPADSKLKAGMFISATLSQGNVQMLTLPQKAIVVRDGFNYAMKVGPDNIVRKTKLTLGKRQGDLVEVLSGLTEKDRVVSIGGSFLNEGDLVNIVDALPSKDKTAPGAAS